MPPFAYISVCVLIACALLCCFADSAAAVYSDAPDMATTPMGEPLTGNALDNASVPPGTAATVTGISVAGTSLVIAPGSGPVTLTAPGRSSPMGTLTVQPDGTFTFAPVPE